MIPKTVHYCWFGNGKKPELVEKCIASWHRHLPDYTFIEWNEKNFDPDINIFVRQAYDNRNYAFVSDYARAYALYNCGGIYLDTDVEILKNFDPLLTHEIFLGFEEGAFIGTCVMGAQKGRKLFEAYMRHYDNTQYKQPDGSFYRNTNVVLMTDMLTSLGLQKNNEFQLLPGGIAVYPLTYFSAYDYINSIAYITGETYSIHHFAQLWLPKTARLKTSAKRLLAGIIGGGRLKKLRKMLGRQ